MPAGLQSLKLHGTQITSLDGIQLPAELQSLDLSDTQITSLDDIRRLQGSSRWT